MAQEVGGYPGLGACRLSGHLHVISLVIGRNHGLMGVWNLKVLGDKEQCLFYAGFVLKGTCHGFGLRKLRLGDFCGIGLHMV